MKKIGKYLVAFILAFALFAITNVNAAVDKTITFHNRSFSGVETYTYCGSTYKWVDTSIGTRVGICMNRVLNAPSNGATLYLDKEVTTPSIVYVLNHGYGGNWNSTLMPGSFSNDQKYYITQLAMWMAIEGTANNPCDANGNVINDGILRDNRGSVTIKRTGTVGKPALALYCKAKVSKVVPNSIAISGGGAMKLSSDGKFYESPAFTLSGSGWSKATLTLVNAGADAKIVVGDKQYASGTKFAPGTKFIVQIPVSKVGADMTITVKATATGTNQKAYRYASKEANKQNIVLVFKDSVSLAATAKATLAPRGALKIIKVDVSSGTEVLLNNVKITVKNSAGAVVKTWVTDGTNNPMVLSNLAIGTYTIIEESAPAGYIKASDVKVTTKDGKTIEVKLQNSKNPSKVKISKQDITTKAELPGAHLVLKDALGKVVDEWDSTATPHYISSLTPGKYSLSETVAPEGYLKTTSTVEFTVERDGGVEKPVVMYNEPIPDNTNIKISKQDITTQKELPGAKLVVKDSTGKIIDEWISTTQPHFVKDLKPGKYTLIESTAPKGYGISDEIIEFEVKADGGLEKTIVMYNSPIPVTADLPITAAVGGLIACVALAGFSVFKLNKQQLQQ